MSGPRSRRTPLDLPAMAANEAWSIWPAPGTVRSITYLGMAALSPWLGAPSGSTWRIRIAGCRVMGYSPDTRESAIRTLGSCHGGGRCPTDRGHGGHVLGHRPGFRATTRAHAALGAH